MLFSAVQGLNLGGDLRQPLTARTDGGTVGLILVGVFLRDGVERDLLGVGDSTGRGHIQMAGERVIQRIRLCGKRSGRCGAVHADGLHKVHIRVGGGGAFGLDPVECVLGFCGICGDGDPCTVHRDDGQPVQLAAGGDQTGFQRLPGEQRRGSADRTGGKRHRQIVIRAEQSGCAALQLVCRRKQHGAVLHHTERLSVREQQGAGAGQQQRGQQEQQPEHAQRTDRTAAAGLPQNTGKAAPDRQSVHKADGTVKQQHQTDADIQQACGHAAQKR